MCLNTPFCRIWFGTQKYHNHIVFFLNPCFLQYLNIPIMSFCSNLMFDHLCFRHCFWMAWDEIVFLQPSHFVRHELFGSVIISFGMFWGKILLGTKTSFCRQSRRFVLQNAPPKVTMVIPQGIEMSCTMRGATGVILQLHQILRLASKINLMIDPPHI